MASHVLQWLALLLIVLIGVISITAIVVSLAGTWNDDDQAGTALYVVSRDENDPVMIQAYVSTDRVGPKDAVQCWFQIHNGGQEDIKNVTLVNWQAPGLRELRFPIKTTATLAAGKSAMFKAAETGSDTNRPVKLNVTAEFSWLANDSERRRLVTIGPILLREPSGPRWKAVSKRYVEYLKDLAIPVLLVWLTIVGSRLLKDSELKRASRGVLLERVRVAAEAQYLVLIASARRAATLVTSMRSKPLNGLTDDDFDLLAFFLLQLFSNLRDVVNLRGGYILPDKEAEEVVADAQNLFTRLLNERVVNMETRTRATAAVPAKATFPEFKDDALSRSAVRSFRQNLRAWTISNHPSTIVLAAALRVFASVLSYEVNVAYFSWYEEWPRLAVDKQDLLDLETSGNPGAIKLAARFRAYERRQEKRRAGARG